MSEDFRRHARWCPAGRPAGVRRLDVFCDYSAFPVWGIGMLSPEGLAISAGLAEELAGWAGEWERRFGIGSGWDADDPAGWPAYRAWFAVGRWLAARLAVETGAVVVYQWPSGPDGGDPTCPRCGATSARSADLADRLR